MTTGVERGRVIVKSGRYAPNDGGELCNSEPDVLAAMRDGAWLDQQEFPPLEYVVPGLVTEGAGMLIGPPKLGKSWLVANIGLACAAGGYALGRIKLAQRPTLYLALEDGDRRLQSRFRTIMQGEPIPAIDYMTQVDRGAALPTIREYLNRHAKRKPLVIVDTFGKVRPRRPGGVDPYQWDYDVCAALKDEVDRVPGASVLVVHHSRKSESADFVDAASGTLGITGAFDFVLVLQRPRHSDAATVSVTGRDVAEAEYALTVTNGKWQLDGDTLTAAASAAETRREQQRLGDRALEVLAFVNSRSEQTRAADLAGLGIDAHQGRTYLSRLADSGRIRKTGRGMYESVASVASVAYIGKLQVRAGDDEDGNATPLIASVANANSNATHATLATPLFSDASDAITCSCGAEISHPDSLRLGTCRECATVQAVAPGGDDQ